MILLGLLIYFILLIFIEVLTIILSRENIYKIYNKTKFENNNSDLNDYEISDEDINLNNFVGYFVLKNGYGFFSNTDEWFILESGQLYNFQLPVNINIIKINDENIEYIIKNK